MAQKANSLPPKGKQTDLRLSSSNAHTLWHQTYSQNIENMGRGKALNEQEKGLILGFSESDKTIREIATRLKCSKNVISNFLRAPAAYGTKKATGRPKKLYPTDKRRLLRAASNATKGSNTLRKELDLSVAARSIRRVLHNDPKFMFEKMISAPMMLPRHLIAQEQFASQKLTWSLSD